MKCHVLNQQLYIKADTDGFMRDLLEDRINADDVGDADANVDSASNDESDDCSDADVDAATAGQYACVHA